MEIASFTSNVGQFTTISQHTKWGNKKIACVFQDTHTKKNCEQTFCFFHFIHQMESDAGWLSSMNDAYNDNSMCFCCVLCFLESFKHFQQIPYVPDSINLVGEL